MFDLDDTLFPEHEYVLSGFRAVGVWLEEKQSIESFFPVAEAFFRKGERGNIFNLALQKLGVQGGDKLVPGMVKVYREHSPDISLFDDARWALEHFKPLKKLGIITDGYLVTQKNKVAALKIENCIDIIIYTDEFGREHWKPSETPYRKLMEALDCRGNECVYVADNPCKDFVTARALEWQTVQIIRKEGEYADSACEKKYEPEAKIATLYELKDYLIIQ